MILLFIRILIVFASLTERNKNQGAQRGKTQDQEQKKHSPHAAQASALHAGDTGSHGEKIKDEK